VGLYLIAEKMGLRRENLRTVVFPEKERTKAWFGGEGKRREKGIHDSPSAETTLPEEGCVHLLLPEKKEEVAAAFITGNEEKRGKGRVASHNRPSFIPRKKITQSA